MFPDFTRRKLTKNQDGMTRCLSGARKQHWRKGLRGKTTGEAF